MLVVISVLCLGGTAVVSATRAAESPYELVVSSSAMRGAAVPLNGATVRGPVYAFVSPDTGVDVVRFHVDDVEQRKAPTKVENDAPFDLGGTMWNTGTPAMPAMPFDTRRLVPGDHSVTAAVILTDGTATVLRARLRVETDGTTTTTASPTTTRPRTTSTVPVPEPTDPPPPPTTAAPTTAPRPPGSGGIAGSLKRGVLFGLGPEASESRGDRLVREAPVGMLSSWYNGPGDLGWMTGWKGTVVPQSYAAGKAMHLIVWTGDAEGPLTTRYGPACGRAYPLSDRFLGDMERLATTFAGAADGPPLFVTMFTEFQTFPCVDNQWSADAETTNYYRALKDRYREAYTVFHRLAPNAKVSLGWGGWQARWDAPATGGGRSLVPNFDDVLRMSDFQSFQAMASDSNVADVRAMTRILGAYGPVMLAHYKPDHRSPATFEADLRTMLSDAYIDEMRAAGLFAFSFMDNADLNSSESMYEFTRAAVQRRGIVP